MKDEKPDFEAEKASGNIPENSANSNTSDTSESSSLAEVSDIPETPNDSQLASQPSSGGRWHRSILILIVVAFFGYMVGLPLVSNLLDRFRPQPLVRTLDEMSLAESVRLRAMQALTGLWFFALGGTIGSFLNVVAYRMPRGESVVFRASRCPKCGNRIPGKDNVPIIGWLNLGGRCRACHYPISPRYPLVEALVASLFFLLFVVQLITGGANLPVRKPPAYTGIVWIIFYTKWDLVLLYLYHCLLVSSLMAWTLIDWDRQRISLGAKLVAGLALLVPVLIWPFLLPVPLTPASVVAYSPTWLQSLQVSLAGAAAGLTLGMALRAAGLTGHIVSGLVLIGLGVGWQAVIAVTLVSLLLRLAGLSCLRLFSRIQVPTMAFVLCGFVLHHVFWQWSIANLSPWWPGPMASLPGWSAIAVGLAVLVAVNALLFREAMADPPEHEPSADLAESSG